MNKDSSRKPPTPLEYAEGRGSRWRTSGWGSFKEWSDFYSTSPWYRSVKCRL